MFSIFNFKDYYQSQRWTIDRYTSEFTLQFRICRFLQSLDSNLVIELESNINRYGLEKFTKKAASSVLFSITLPPIFTMDSFVFIINFLVFF